MNLSFDDALVGRAQHWTESFRAVDWNGDGRMDLLYNLAATGEIFALHVRVEDVNSNPRAAFVGDLSVVVDGVECTRVSMSPDDRGIIEVAGLSLSEPGIFRFSVSTVDGLMSAISNPIRCADAPASRVYWGDMHCHADYADAVGSVEWNHDFARNSARLDFFSQTDHIYSTPGWATGAFNRPLVLDVRTMWAECQRQARKWYEPGRFVTFLGYERTPWERRQRAGDLTVWFMDDDSDLVIEDTIAATIESVKQRVRRFRCFSDRLRCRARLRITRASSTLMCSFRPYFTRATLRHLEHRFGQLLTILPLLYCRHQSVLYHPPPLYLEAPGAVVVPSGRVIGSGLPWMADPDEA